MCLSVVLSICVSECGVVSLSVLHLSMMRLSVCWSVCLSVCLYVCLSTCQHTCMPVSLSVCVCVIMRCVCVWPAGECALYNGDVVAWCRVVSGCRLRCSRSTPKLTPTSTTPPCTSPPPACLRSARRTTAATSHPQWKTSPTSISCTCGQCRVHSHSLSRVRVVH